MDIGALLVGSPLFEADGDRNVTEIGVPNKYRARQFICLLRVTDKMGTNTLPHVFVTMVVKLTFSQKHFYPMNVWTLRLSTSLSCTINRIIGLIGLIGSNVTNHR